MINPIKFKQKKEQFQIGVFLLSIWLYLRAGVLACQSWLFFFIAKQINFKPQPMKAKFIVDPCAIQAAVAGIKILGVP